MDVGIGILCLNGIVFIIDRVFFCSLCISKDGYFFWFLVFSGCCDIKYFLNILDC